MGLETATFISDLVGTNPVSSDLRSEGDDHLRLTKNVLKNTFPNASRAEYHSRAVAKTTSYTIVVADQNKIITCTSSGTNNQTLPTLGASNDGWSVTIVKTDANTNAVTVVGTINGETNFVLNRQYQAVDFIWTGSVWIAFHAVRVINGVPTVVDADVLGTLDVTGASTFASTVSIAGILSLTSTSHVALPNGTTAQRPSPAAGQFRYNSTTTSIEYYNGTSWETVRGTINPAIQVLTSGSGTYNTPTVDGRLPLYLRVRMVGGGGGGGARTTNAGSSGTNSVFGSWTAVAGAGGSTGSGNATGGTGGTDSTGTVVRRLAGEDGSAGSNSGGAAPGGKGGASLFGGGGAGPGGATAGLNAKANTGSGGSGAGASAGTGSSGGAAGEFVEFIITAPATSYPYTVGAAGAGGAAGGDAGGNGAAGRIEVEAYWN